MTDKTFAELGLGPELVAAVDRMGFERPSLIQVKSIPVALSGRDLVGLSQTGSGKTAAFALPILNRIDFTKNHVQALILCPTRELAVQVCEETNRLGSSLPGFHAFPVYGGAPIDRQMRALRDGVQVIVGTPGRLLDHLRRGTFKPEHVLTVVLDEADRMLDMGFREEMEELLASMPKNRQTLFFSATMNRGVRSLIEGFSNQPEIVEIERKELTVSTIEQVSYEVRNRSKIEVLSRLIDLENPRLAIVFCNTKRSVDETTEAMLARGYTADRLHGDITQTLRERTLSRFREGKVEILVATDVAARGIDVEEIDLVVNLDLPNDAEDYVHRIGRTGRAGRSGKAVSFVFGRDIYRLQGIERYTKHAIRRERIPTQEMVEGKRADAMLDRVRESLEAGTYANNEELLGRLLDQGHTATDICNALFSLLRESMGREGEEIQEDREGHRSERRSREDRGERTSIVKRGEHGERPEREPRGERAPRERFEHDRGPSDNPPASGWSRLVINLGSEDGAKPGEIAGMLYRESGIADGSLGKIKLFRRHTLIDVREDLASQVIKGTAHVKLRGRKLRVDYDRFQ